MSTGANVFGKKIVPEAVQQEIRRRVDNRVTWTGQRFPWIRVISMCESCSTQYTYLSSIQGDLYEPNFIRPLPTIASLDVKKQGELGTTRRATVKIVAYTDAQLKELQKCYLIAGMSVRVEWGWSTPGSTYPQDSLARNLSDNDAIKQIKTRTSTNPNYEGLQGIVANFSYTLTADNYWDCSIEIISAAEAFESTKVNDYTCGNCVDTVTNQGEDGETKESKSLVSPLFKCLKALIDDFDEASGIYNGELSDVINKGNSVQRSPAFMQAHFNGPSRDENGTAESNFFSWLGNTSETDDVYISWATLEAAVNKYCIPQQKKSEYSLGKVASVRQYLTFHPCLMSIDPRICVINVNDDTKQMIDDIKGSFPSAVVDDTDNPGKRAVLLDNIMVNATALLIEVKAADKNNDGTIMTFLKNMLSKINEACGSLWEFESVTSEDTKHPVLSFIDAKRVVTTTVPYSIPSQPTNSVVRDLKMTSKMTEAMKTQALYSNTNKTQATNGKGNDPCGTEAMKAIRKGADGSLFVNLAIPPEPAPSPNNTSDSRCSGCNKGDSAEAPPTFDELLEEAVDEVNDSTVSALQTALIKAYNDSLKSNDDAQCHGIVLPFEFSFTVDGIGGFSFGQVITSERIPESFRNSYIYQVTSVEHSVSPNDWTTTVNTVPRFVAKNGKSNPSIANCDCATTKHSP